MCFNNAWGTICDHSFSSSDAKVVCTQLGYRFNETKVLPIFDFSQGSGPIFLDELACDGDEENVLECGGSAPGLHSCTHSQDAAIRCIGECYFMGGCWGGRCGLERKKLYISRTVLLKPVVEVFILAM